MMKERSELSVALLCMLGALGILLCMLSMNGCATTDGLTKAQTYLPTVADGVHRASSAGHNVLHTLCTIRATDCQKNGITDKDKCPGWKRCDAVRVALEEVTRAVEDDLVGLKSKFEAFKKVQAAIETMKKESGQ